MYPHRCVEWLRRSTASRARCARAVALCPFGNGTYSKGPALESRFVAFSNNPTHDADTLYFDMLNNPFKCSDS